MLPLPLQPAPVQRLHFFHLELFVHPLKALFQLSSVPQATDLSVPLS